MIFTSASDLSMQNFAANGDVVPLKRQKETEKRRATGAPGGSEWKYLKFHSSTRRWRIIVCSFINNSRGTIESTPEPEHPKVRNNMKLLKVFIQMMIMKAKVAESEWSSSMNSLPHADTLI